MNINPPSDQDLSPKIKDLFEKFKRVIKVNQLPIFFYYLAAFPDYLEFLAPQILANWQDKKFQELTGELTPEIISLSRELEKPKLSEALSQNFFKITKFPWDKLVLTNIYLAIILLAQRESIKGWALGVRKIPASHEKFSQAEQEANLIKDEPLIEKSFLVNLNQSKNEDISPIVQVSSTSLNSQMFDETLIEYLSLFNKAYKDLFKKDYFWATRIGIEKTLLLHLDFLPKPFIANINHIIDLTKKYPHFDDLIHLLYDLFPTRQIHQLLFSAYLVP